MESQRRDFLEKAVRELSEQDRHHLLIDVLGVEHIEEKLSLNFKMQREQGIRCRECESLALKLGIS